MSNNASNIVVIVQSVLFFLSAVVAVVGYLIQSKLKMKEQKEEMKRVHEQKLKEMKLLRIREKLDTFLSPAMVQGIKFYGIYHETLAPQGFLPRKMFIGNEKEAKYNMEKTMDGLTNKGVTKYWNSLGIKYSDIFKLQPTMNLIPSFVGPEIEEQIRQNPESEIGKLYIRSCERLILNCGKKAAVLIETFVEHLGEFCSLEEYAEQFPIVKDSYMKRITILSQFICFIDEFEYIINKYWVNKDYSLLFPMNNFYPTLFGLDLNGHLNRITTQEAELGSNHKNMIGISNKQVSQHLVGKNAKVRSKYNVKSDTKSDHV